MLNEIIQSYVGLAARLLEPKVTGFERTFNTVYGTSVQLAV